MSESQVEFDQEEAVRARYSGGAKACDSALCCPIRYEGRLLDVIPAEVIERDYGCGDPTPFVEPGQTVLDLGSGSGKACFVVSQLVGRGGRVIGVDMNDDMLALARGAAPLVAERLGYANVEFRKARIQDLRLDRQALDVHLQEHPVHSERELCALEDHIHQQRAQRPLVADATIDLVISNCVLNLVRQQDKSLLFAEMARVLRPGGRAAISDIVSDRDVPSALQRDPELWSGCISGAFREDRFLQAFRDAGFERVDLVDRQAQPWRVVDGIEFRALTLVASRGAGTRPGVGPKGAAPQGCC